MKVDQRIRVLVSADEAAAMSDTEAAEETGSGMGNSLSADVVVGEAERTGDILGGMASSGGLERSKNNYIFFLEI